MYTTCHATFKAKPRLSITDADRCLPKEIQSPLPPNTRHRSAHVLKYFEAFGDAQAPARIEANG